MTDFRFLSISDLHFNPCSASGIIPALAKAAPADWEGVLAGVSPYGQDSNFPLLASFLADAAGQATDSQFMLFSGDFLAHRLHRYYQQAVGEGLAGFEAFIEKTVLFLADQFQRAFPGKVVFPVLGNDDSYDGDYRITTDSGFLEMFMKAWAPIMDGVAQAGGSTSFAQTFTRGGYYSSSLPGLPDRQLLVLNNIFMSNRYAGSDTPSTISAQLAWLDTALAACAGDGKRAWVMMHEPLGVNVWTSLHPHNRAIAEQTVTFLQAAWHAQLLATLEKYHAAIEIVFSGHTHMDEFRLVHDSGGQPILHNHITPAVSPLFGNNPAYQVFTLAPDGRGIADYTTRYLDLGAAVAGQADWQPEYSFAKRYAQPGLDATSLMAVWKAMGQRSSLRDDFIKGYSVAANDEPAITAADWPAYYDGIVDITAKEFDEDLATEDRPQVPNS